MKLFSFPPALREVIELQIQRLQTRSQPIVDEDVTGLLQDEKETPADLQQNRSRYNQSKKTGILVFVVGLLLIVSLASYPIKQASSADVYVPKVKWSPGVPKAADHYFQVILPTQLNTTESCKTLLTGAVLNYPSPWVVNWRPRLDEQGNEVDPTLAKLESIFNLLQTKSPKHENDTALVLANPNTWFQLRPEVLLARYWDIQEQHANAIERQYGKERVRVDDIRPKVLITAQNACQSKPAQGSGCITAQAPNNTSVYVGHDLLIGKFSDMRNVYRHAVDLAKAALEAQKPIDEHRIFAHIYSEQESHRQAPKSNRNDLDTHDIPRKDFGLYIDFARQLSYTASTTQGDTATWIHPNTTTTPPLPQDIVHSPPPFWTLFSSTKWNRPWTSVPFLLNKPHSQIPVLIQRAPDADPAFATTAYQNLWFHPHGRELLDHFAFTLYVPTAVVKNPYTGREVRFWPPVFAKPGFETDDDRFHRWAGRKVGKGVCGVEVVDPEGVFLDGRGEWRDPRP